MNRPPPQFRPRKAKQQPISRRWRLIVAFASLALLAAAGGIIALVLTSGDDGSTAAAPTTAPGAQSTGGTAGAQSTGGTAGGPETVIKGPAYAYVLQVAEAPEGYEVNKAETYILSALASATVYFSSARDGETQFNEWSYRDGYQASLQPTGQAADLARGKYYARTETLIFDSVDGARQAYNYLEKWHESTKGSERQQAAALGNQSSAWKISEGVVPGTELPGVYHRFIFRRGSLVSVVQTYGATQFVTAAISRDIAVLVDDKVLGKRPAPTPTPPKNATQSLPPLTPTPTR